MPNALTGAQIRFLRGQAHGLKPLLQLGGKGLTDSFVEELNAGLEIHELVKVKLGGDDRVAREALGEVVAERTASTIVQRIGHVVVLYREAKDGRRIVLPRG